MPLNKRAAHWINELKPFDVLANVKLGKQRYFAVKCRDRLAAAGEKVGAQTLDKHIKLAALAERVTAKRAPLCDDDTLREGLQALVDADVDFRSDVKEALLTSRSSALTTRVMEGTEDWLASKVMSPLSNTLSGKALLHLVPRPTI